MTCQHIPIKREPLWGIALVTCQDCNHHWREAPIQLDEDDYCAWLFIEASLGPRQPDGLEPDGPTRKT